MYNIDMENNIHKKLDKPPIKEVILGIAFENLFNTPKDIEDFYEQSAIKSKFITKEDVKEVKFEISEKPKISQDIISGCILTSADKHETINIVSNTVMFSDKSQYVSYENFITKFNNIMENILLYCSKPLTIKEIGLRYINNFNLNSQKLESEFKIVPTLNLINPNDQTSLYAAMSNSLSMVNIQSAIYPNMFATVKTVYKAHNPLLLNITFDIDTHDTTTYTISSKEELNEKIILLKEFKNMIFFSNFEDAYKMEEFK